MSSRYSADDIYCYPNSTVLKNKLGLQDQQQLDLADADYCAIRIVELDENPIKGQFDLSHLRKIHHALFQDVYDWAGEIRTVDLTLKDSRFANVQYIEENANKLFKKLAADHYLKNLEFTQLPYQLAHYLSEINVLHPFRDGNGRAQRIFISQLCKDLGYQIKYSDLDEIEFYTAMENAFFGDESLLTQIIQKILK
jgi:cell filamentation protein